MQKLIPCFLAISLLLLQTACTTCQDEPLAGENQAAFAEIVIHQGKYMIGGQILNEIETKEFLKGLPQKTEVSVVNLDGKESKALNILVKTLNEEQIPYSLTQP